MFSDRCFLIWFNGVKMLSDFWIENVFWSIELKMVYDFWTTNAFSSIKAFLIYELKVFSCRLRLSYTCFYICPSWKDLRHNVQYLILCFPSWWMASIHGIEFSPCCGSWLHWIGLVVCGLASHVAFVGHLVVATLIAL